MDRTRYTFFIDADLRDAIAAIKERDGIPESEQIRRALRAWVDAKGGTSGANERARTPARRKTTKRGRR